MTVLVTDRGFGDDDWAGREILPFETLAAGGDLPADGLAIDFPNDRDPAELAPWFGRLALVRIAFPSFTDGRGFSVATRLRGLGYGGRLRARGYVIADQYTALRRSGFDEVEIPEDLARRQPETSWKLHDRPDYRARIARA